MMKWLRTFSINTRVLFVITVTLGILGVGALLGMYGIMRIGNDVRTLAGLSDDTNAANDMCSGTARMHKIVVNDVINEDIPGANTQLQELNKEAEKAITKVTKIDDPQIRHLTSSVKSDYDRYWEIVQAVVIARETDKSEDLSSLASQLSSGDKELSTSINDLRGQLNQQINVQSKNANQTQIWAQWMLVFMSLTTLTIAGTIGGMLMRSITKPLENLAKVADRISEGDMDVKIVVTGKDQIGRLEKAIKTTVKQLKIMIKKEAEAKKTLEENVHKLSDLSMMAAEGDLTVQAPEFDGELGYLSTGFNQMTSSLHKLVEKLVEVINQLGSASTEIEVTAQQQASGANEQAASVSQVTAAINELATNSSEVAKATGFVSEAANEALNSAIDGKDVSAETIEGMQKIKETNSTTSRKILALEEKSQEIGSVLAIIDDIAEQTNLLALNAAIEAARAGEAGKGFAVVAQEIRNLAEDVTTSTKEIGEKINEIQSAINTSVMVTEEGIKRTDEEMVKVRRAGTELDKIIKLTERTSELATQISSAIQQQKSASEQVVSTMGEVSEVARQSATGSQESAKSAQDLAKIAGEVKEMVRIFKIDK